MKLKEILTLCSKKYSLIKSGDIIDQDIKVLQIINSVNQISLPGSLCLILKYDKNMLINPKCHYLIPADYISYNFKENVSLYDSKDFLSLAQFLQDILVDKDEYFDKISLISAFINSNPSLQDVCRYISQMFDKPVVFVDVLFTSIAVYPLHKTGIEVFDIHLDSRYKNVDTSYQQSNIQEFIYPEILRSILISFKPYNVPCVCSPIYSSGRHDGGVAMFAPDNDISQTDLKVIEYAMMLIGNKSLISDARSQVSYGHFHELLINGMISDEELKEQAQRLNVDLNSKYKMLIIGLNPQAKSIDQKTLKLKNYLNTELCGVYDNNLVFTFKENVLNPELLNYLMAKVEENKEQICVFDIPFDITKLNTVYLLSKKYLGIGSCFENYYKLVFENYEFFSDINKSNLLYYDKLKQLKKEEYETIKEYLYSFQNLHHTAKILNIHRNTLTYRLEKIASVLNIDYENHTQMLNLLLTIKLL